MIAATGGLFPFDSDSQAETTGSDDVVVADDDNDDDEEEALPVVADMGGKSRVEFGTGGFGAVVGGVGGGTLVGGGCEEMAAHETPGFVVDSLIVELDAVDDDVEEVDDVDVEGNEGPSGQFVSACGVEEVEDEVLAGVIALPGSASSFEKLAL